MLTVMSMTNLNLLIGEPKELVIYRIVGHTSLWQIC